MKIIHDPSLLDHEKGTCWRSDSTFIGYGTGYPEKVDLINFTVRNDQSDTPCRVEVMLKATMHSKFYQRRMKQTQKLSFFWIDSGEMYFRSNNRVLLAEPGDCVLLKPHCRNDFLHEDQRECSYYEFILAGAMLDDFLRIYKLEHVFCLKLDDQEFFRNLFERTKDLERVGAISTVFPELSGSAVEILQKISSSVQIRHRASYVAEIGDFLEQRLREKISMTEIAGRFRVDIHEMNRDFQHFYGVTPYQYRRRFRLRRAAEMLRAGNLVKEVAGAVGYRNAKTFSTEFRQFYGFSPRGCQQCSPEILSGK